MRIFTKLMIASSAFLLAPIAFPSASPENLIYAGIVFCHGMIYVLAYKNYPANELAEIKNKPQTRTQIVLRKIYPFDIIISIAVATYIANHSTWLAPLGKT